MKIGIIEPTVEARNRLRSIVECWVAQADSGLGFAPRAVITTLAPEELRFNGDLDLCLVGPELLAFDASIVASVRAQYSSGSLICFVDNRTNSLAVVEQLGRLGVDDVFAVDGEGHDFMRRLVLTVHRTRKGVRGLSILVDGAKGGIGVTSFTAALGEAFVDHGKTVCLVDGDSESQDLSRFLQAKPYINEGLESLLTRQRMITPEGVRECVVPVWRNESRLLCLTPVRRGWERSCGTHDPQRAWDGLRETLEECFDITIFDSSGFPLEVRELLARNCKRTIAIVSNDPAGFIATAQRLQEVSDDPSQIERLALVEYRQSSEGISSRFLRTEICRVTPVPSTKWCEGIIPYCSSVANWPASGATPYSISRRVRKAVQQIASQFCALEYPASVISDEKQSQNSISRSQVLISRCSVLIENQAKKLIGWYRREKPVVTAIKEEPWNQELLMNLKDPDSLVTKPAFMET